MADKKKVTPQRPGAAGDDVPLSRVTDRDAESRTAMKKAAMRKTSLKKAAMKKTSLKKAAMRKTGA